MADCLYLRKSRVDTDLETHGAGDTLLRHEEALLRHARALERPVTHIYRELVSGETIAARPEMQCLLRDVEAGLWDAVHVMEIERLARGDTLDQGLVAQSFRYSGTLIITPQKTYDPGNEFDEEYFEFGLFMSRREYKTINRRQQTGRLASAREGKWVGNRAPYGYRRVKLEGQKGWTLEPEEPQASVVRDVFRWLTEEGFTVDGRWMPFGTTRIAKRLNALAIPSPNGGEWAPGVLRELLRNPAYAGWVRWGHRAQEKCLLEGSIAITRPRHVECSCFSALHPPLVTQECFAKAQKALQSTRTHPVSGKMAMKNPLAGLLFCAFCGRAMTRRAYEKDQREVLLCPTLACPAMASELCEVEETLLCALFVHFQNIPFLAKDLGVGREKEAITLQQSMKRAKREEKQIQVQLEKVYALLENGIYGVEEFHARSTALRQRQESLEAAYLHAQTALSELAQQYSWGEECGDSSGHVLDCYAMCNTVEEKNVLLHSLLSKVLYSKTQGGRYQKSDLTLYLFPQV